jgi:hemerythrin
MPLVNWSQELVVDVREIDEQHRKLVTMLNGLHDAMKVGQGGTQLSRLLDEMASYAVVHFATEEKYMTTYNYPSCSTHKSEHQKFVGQVTDFRKAFGEGRMSLTLEMMNFLKDWLTGHILGVDKKYAAFFAAKGLK